MKRTLPAAAAAITAAVLLAACGGSGGSNDIVFEDSTPESSNRSGSIVVDGSATVARNGVYASSNVFLNAVEKVNPVGEEPELCRFRFDRLDQAGSTLRLGGDVRYQPGTNTIKVMYAQIDGVTYGLINEFGTVDRANNEIDLAGARLNSGTGGETITLTGSIPMRDGRPEGC